MSIDVSAWFTRPFPLFSARQSRDKRLESRENLVARITLDFFSFSFLRTLEKEEQACTRQPVRCDSHSRSRESDGTDLLTKWPHSIRRPEAARRLQLIHGKHGKSWRIAWQKEPILQTSLYERWNPAFPLHVRHSIPQILQGDRRLARVWRINQN